MKTLFAVEDITNDGTDIFFFTDIDLAYGALETLRGMQYRAAKLLDEHPHDNEFWMTRDRIEFQRWAQKEYAINTNRLVIENMSDIDRTSFCSPIEQAAYSDLRVGQYFGRTPYG